MDFLSQLFTFKPENQVAPREMTVDGKPSKLREVDADTFKSSSGESFRVTGINAPETAKNKVGLHVPGGAGEALYSDAARRIAEKGNFKALKRTGEKDAYGRTLAGISQDGGLSLSSALLALGVEKVRPNTSLEDMAAAGSLEAASALMPERAAGDPVRAIGKQFREDELERFGGSPVLGMRRTAIDSQTNAAARSMFGPKAANDFEDEVRRLTGILSDPSNEMRPETRTKLTEDLLKAQQNMVTALTVPNPISGVAHRQSDRDSLNRSTERIWTSLANSGYDVLKLVTGNSEMIGAIGSEFGWDDLEERAKRWNMQIKQRQMDLPTTLASMADIDTTNPWTAIGDTFEFLTNMGAGMLPQIGVMVGATALGGPVAGAGVTGAMYAGQFYADQDEDKKNAGLAWGLGITAGVLDRLGLSAIVRTGTINLMTKEGRDFVIGVMGDKMRAKLGRDVSKKEITKALEEATKAELVSATKMTADMARKQVFSAEAALRGLAVVTAKGGSEGFTELGQTYAEMVAKSGVASTDVQYEKGFYQALMDAAAGGMGLGATLGGAKQAFDVAQWHAIANGQAPNKTALEEFQLYQAEQRKKALLNDDTAFTDIRTEAVKMGVEAQLASAPPITSLKGTDTAYDTLRYLISSPMQLFRQLGTEGVRSILNKNTGAFKENLARLKAIMGGYGVAPGEHAMRRKQNLIGEWGGSTLNSDWLSSQLQTDPVTAVSILKKAWNKYYSKSPDRAAMHKLVQADPELQQHSDVLARFMESADAMAESIRETAAEAGVLRGDSMAIVNEIFSAPTLDADKLAANRALVEEIADEAAAADPALKARDIMSAFDKLLSNNPTEVSVANNYLHNTGILKDPRLAEMVDPDIFENISTTKAKHASRIVNAEYLGQDGQTLSYLIQQAKANGEFESPLEEQRAITAAKAFYESFHGEYRPIKTKMIKDVIGWMVALPVLSGLGKAAISSLPEVPISTLGTSGDLVQRQMQEYAIALKREIAADFNKAAVWTLNKRILRGLTGGIARKSSLQKDEQRIREIEAAVNDPSTSRAKLEELSKELEVLGKRHLGHQLFYTLGYGEVGYNAASKYELNDSRLRKTMNVFATAIGLRAQTDATRMAILAVAGDVLTDKFDALGNIPAGQRELALRTGKGLTNEQAGYLKELQSYGFNVPEVLNMIDSLRGEADHMGFFEAMAAAVDPERTADPKYAAIAKSMHNAIGNFVDAKAVNPQIHNLPRFYQDPRMRVFTAMTRFIATQTAHMLPLLYRDYVARGNAAMRYQAFSVMVGAIMAAAAANVLKDLLAFGDTENPYLKSQRQIAQRALYGSSLLGKAERVVDAVLPLYPERRKGRSDAGPIEASANWVWENLKDNSPTASWLAKTGTAAGYIAEGDVPNAARGVARIAPITGSYPIVGDTLRNFLKE